MHWLTGWLGLLPQPDPCLPQARLQVRTRGPNKSQSSPSLTQADNELQLTENVERFPLRDVSQESSTTLLSFKNKCDSWLSPCRAQSNLVSQSDGWRGNEVNIERSYSSVRKETIAGHLLP